MVKSYIHATDRSTNSYQRGYGNGGGRSSRCTDSGTVVTTPRLFGMTVACLLPGSEDFAIVRCLEFLVVLSLERKRPAGQSVVSLD